MWGWNNGGSNSGGVIGGGQIGYNFQVTPMFVVGAETDFQGTSLGSGGGNNNNWGWLFGFPPVATARLNWFGTVRGRVGITLLSPQLLVYGTGGFAYGEVQRNGWLNQNSAVQTGWTAGGGAEWMFFPNWSAKVEYLYTQISGTRSNNNWLWAFNPGWGLNNVNNRTRFHTIRAGINYHFNFGSPAPVSGEILNHYRARPKRDELEPGLCGRALFLLDKLRRRWPNGRSKECLRRLPTRFSFLYLEVSAKRTTHTTVARGFD